MLLLYFSTTPSTKAGCTFMAWSLLGASTVQTIDTQYCHLYLT